MFLLRLHLLHLVVRFQCCGNVGVDIYQQYCPFSDLCYNNSVFSLEKYVFPDNKGPCCPPCYCDSQCITFSDCCPDSQVDSFVLLGEKTTCQYAHYVNSSIKKTILLSPYAYAWPIQSACPHNYSGPWLDKCLERFDRTPSLDDISVVSDSSHLSRIYKNKYCAECHGVKQVTRWIASTGYCIRNHAEWDLSNRDVWQFLLYNCEIHFHPAHELPIHADDCISPFKGCHRQYYQGFDVQKACSSYSLPLMHFGGNRAYNNLYCYLCLSKEDNPKQTICYRRSSISDSRNRAMRIILDLRPKVFQLKSTHQTWPCAKGEIYDNIFVDFVRSITAKVLQNLCRSINCVWNAKFYEDRCELIGNVVQGIRIKVSVLLYVQSAVNDTDQTVTSDEAARQQEDFMLRTQLFECPFELFYITKFVNLQTNFLTNFELTFYQIAPKNCSYDNVRVRLYEKIPLSWKNTIHFGNNVYDTIAKINFQNFLGSLSSFPYSSEFSRKFVFKYRFLAPMTRNVDLLQIDMFPCPHFMLNASEYNFFIEYVLNKNHTIEEISLATILEEGFYVIGKKKIALCINSFMGMLNSGNTRYTCLNVIVVSGVLVLCIGTIKYI